MITHEKQRLNEVRETGRSWRLWGPYLSERQWGTVREDYSKDGDAWAYFSHDQSRSRAYRWGEDGLAGISDDHQRLCFSIALWNYKDPILKERLFGLTNPEGNHGEDAKEYYFYLDSTPTHSYMKYLYKYPHNAYPYDDIVKTNAHRSKLEKEYELIDTGVFADNKYFDIEVEYAKADVSDILINVTVHNRGASAASLVLIPTLWFRNTWTDNKSAKPEILVSGKTAGLIATHPELGKYTLFCDGAPQFVFTENETNEKYYTDPNWNGYAKDAFHRFLIHNEESAVNPAQRGTKSAALYRLEVPAQGSITTRLRLREERSELTDPFGAFDASLQESRAEADEFYGSIIPSKLTPDEKNVMRQALAGMLWSKQYYFLDNDLWLRQHGEPTKGRNVEWSHILNSDIISMPDKWEYPWYAAWDLAFNTIPLAIVDIDFAKKQLDLMFSDVYMHGNGQLPAYEWNFSDVNPPVHAWAALTMMEFQKAETGCMDLTFLRGVYHKLLLTFTWWLNKKDARGCNVFEGGFLGLDNIGVFDRSSPLPGGGYPRSG